MELPAPAAVVLNKPLITRIAARAVLRTFIAGRQPRQAHTLLAQHCQALQLDVPAISVEALGQIDVGHLPAARVMVAHIQHKQRAL